MDVLLTLPQVMPPLCVFEVAVCRPHLCEQDPSALERVSGLAALHRDMEVLLAAADEGDEDGEGQGQGLGLGKGDDEDWSEL